MILQDYIQDEILTGKKRSVSIDQSLIGSGVLDSVRLLQLIAFVEKRFAIQVADTEMVADNFKTIARITSLIESKRGTVPDSGAARP
jgi:acyl carrier protein